ncbi:TraR/DksA C4-type zinc finger protein [Halopseudomonas oceani]|uniref:TraR/DksA C4-type zinc finger protein n=1 Tax=Halopseudomonas oceani TaxID=1708783 RepID=UPI002AA865A2|nr:TraR/DksA C4-type zinc finger protein [Halopseudomonas oceani]
MPDFGDLGAERTQQMIDDALAERRYQASRLAIDNPYCVACGQAIPLKRREVVPGCEYCIHCQSINEQRKGAR